MIERFLCKKLFYLPFFRAVDVFYDCFEKQRYLTIRIKKYPIGGRLELGNSIPEIKEWCNDCGIMVSGKSLYGYVIFDYGYLLFGGSTLRETHFGYSLWKSKTEKDSKDVSTFCTYVPITELNLLKKIQLLKTNN